MLFTYNKPSNEIINKINSLVEKFYPEIIPEEEKEPICKEILEYNGITDPCAMEKQQAIVVFNYHAAKAMQNILSNKYGNDKRTILLDTMVKESEK